MGLISPTESFHSTLIYLYMFCKRLYQNLFIRNTFKGGTNTAISFQDNDESDNTDSDSSASDSESEPDTEVGEDQSSNSILNSKVNDSQLMHSHCENSNDNDINHEAECVNTDTDSDNNIVDSLKQKVSQVSLMCVELQEKIVKLSNPPIENCRNLSDPLNWNELQSKIVELVVHYMDNQCSALKEKPEQDSKSVTTKDENIEEVIQNLQSEVFEKLGKLQDMYRTKMETMESEHKMVMDEYYEKNPSDVLREEVRSLEVVLDLRNEEIKRLHEDLIYHREIQEEMILSKEHNKRLVARVEDIEAQMEKGRQDKKELQQKLMSLEDTISLLKSDNYRLSKCNEELCWKIRTYGSNSHEIG